MRQDVMAGAICISVMLLLIPISAQEVGDNTKVIVVLLNINNNTITELESEVIYGHPPNLGLQYGHFKVELLSYDGNLIKGFGIWDPRIQFGDEVVSDESGDISRLVGKFVFEKNINFTVIFPFYENLKTVNVYNSTTDELLTSLDLTDTIIDFCSQHEDDPECARALKYQQPRPSVLPIALIVVLIGAVVAVLVGVLRRKKD